MTFYKILLIVAGLAMFSACSSHKNSVASEQSAPSRKVKAKRIPEVADLAETYSDWQTFYAPFNLKVAEPMPMGVSGRATMVRDEYVYLSLRVMGFEVASVYVGTDSAIIADKYHKIMVAEPLESLTARTGLTVGNLQDILLGRAFYPGLGTLCSIEGPDYLFSPRQEGELTTLMPRKIPGGVEWRMAMDESPALRLILVEPEGQSPFVAEYSDIASTPAGSVASNVKVEGEAAGKPIEVTCQWNLGKAKWNEVTSEPSLSFKGYRRLSGTELMEILRNQ